MDVTEIVVLAFGAHLVGGGYANEDAGVVVLLGDAANIVS